MAMSNCSLVTVYHRIQYSVHVYNSCLEIVPLGLEPLECDYSVVYNTKIRT